MSTLRSMILLRKRNSSISNAAARMSFLNTAVIPSAFSLATSMYSAGQRAEIG
ncbi:hypothetical protein C0992_002869, partial [Termitomyces sp. T32_za158]